MINKFLPLKFYTVDILFKTYLLAAMKQNEKSLKIFLNQISFRIFDFMDEMAKFRVIKIMEFA